MTLATSVERKILPREFISFCKQAQVRKIRVVSHSGERLYVVLSQNHEDPNSLEKLFEDTLKTPINGSLTCVRAEIQYRRSSSFYAGTLTTLKCDMLIRTCELPRKELYYPKASYTETT